MRSNNFNNEKLVILDPNKMFLKISAAENGKEPKRYFSNTVSNCPIYSFSSYKYLAASPAQ